MKIDYLEIIYKIDETFIVKNMLSGKYVKLGCKEVKYLLEVLKVKEHLFDLGDEELHDEHKEFIYAKFKEWGFLSKEEPINRKSEKRFEDFSRIKLFSLNPNSVLKIIYPILSPFFTIPGLVLLTITTMVVLIFWMSQIRLISGSLVNLDLSLEMNIKLFITMVVAIVIHEFSHAVVCKKHGGSIDSMGMLLFFGFPAFYCNVSDIYLMNRRRHVFEVAIAGLLSNMFISNIAFIIYMILLINNIYLPILFYFYIANVGFIVFNLIPFVKLDGYWIVSSLIGVNNLLNKSIIVFIQFIIDSKKLSTLNEDKKVILIGYGMITFLFRPVFWSMSLQSIYETLHSLLGVEYAVPIFIIIIIVVIYDLYKFYSKVLRLYKNDSMKIIRNI